jgi:hypothetical protein
LVALGLATIGAVAITWVRRYSVKAGHSDTSKAP